jgi:hypothetical protein
MVGWTVQAATNTAMTAYIALRLAQDGATVTLDQAIMELIAIGSKIHDHGGVFGTL